MKARISAQSHDASNIKKNIHSDETYETRSKKPGGLVALHASAASSILRSPGRQQKRSQHPFCANLQGSGARARSGREKSVAKRSQDPRSPGWDGS